MLNQNLSSDQFGMSGGCPSCGATTGMGNNNNNAAWSGPEGSYGTPAGSTLNQSGGVASTGSIM